MISPLGELYFLASQISYYVFISAWIHIMDRDGKVKIIIGIRMSFRAFSKGLFLLPKFNVWEVLV